MIYFPIAFTLRVRRDSSWPFPKIIRRVSPQLPILQPFCDLVSQVLPRRTVVLLVFLYSFFFCYSLHIFSLGQSMSSNLFCISTTSFINTLWCLSVHSSWVFFRSKAWISSNHTTFFQLFALLLCCPSLPMHHLACKTVMSAAICPSIIKGCHGGHLIPRSRFLP